MSTFSLESVCRVIVDNRGKTCPTADEGTPLIATNCVVDGQRAPVIDNKRFVAPETMKSWFRGHPEPGDILFVCKGTPGRVAMVPEPVTFCIAQDMVALRIDSNIASAEYIYYYLTSPEVRKQISDLHVGSMIPHFKKGDFGRLAITLPPLWEQEAIAEVLGSLDDKIESNLKKVRVVEEHFDSRAYSRLVDARQKQAVSEVATLTKGTSYSRKDLCGEHWLVSLKCIGRDGRFAARGLKDHNGSGRPSQQVSHGDLVVALTDLTQNADVVGKPCVVGEIPKGKIATASLDVGVIRPTRDVDLGVLYWSLKHPEFSYLCRAVATGTTVLHVDSKAMMSYQLPVVDDTATAEIQDAYWKFVNLTESSNKENRVLAELRDTLLGPLVSGRLRVKDAEQMVGDVL